MNCIDCHGVDITAIEWCWQLYGKLKVISEIGTDISRWKNSNYFCSMAVSYLRVAKPQTDRDCSVLQNQANFFANRAAAALKMIFCRAFRIHTVVIVVFCTEKSPYKLGAAKVITCYRYTQLARKIYALISNGGSKNDPH